MDQLDKGTRQISSRVWFAGFMLHTLNGLGCLWLMYTGVSLTVVAAAYTGATCVIAIVIALLAGYWAKLPLRALGSAILHASPGENPTEAPRITDLKIGHGYVTAMAYQLYQIANLQDIEDLATHKREATQASNILSRLPLPLFVFNKQQQVTYASDSALEYVNLESAKLFGQSLFGAIDFEFPNDTTLASWIADCEANKVNDTMYWRRVRIKLKDEANSTRQCDVAAYYNRDNPSGIEFIITLFDRTAEYTADDDSLSFTALAVHELRTPLTLMRGLIEVFEEELSGKLDAELQGYMLRLQSSAQALAIFVSNILNVAKVENDQLIIRLAEEKWEDLIQNSIHDMKVKADSLGMTISLDIEKDLPTVAADRLTSYEVVCNLLDNAIKYSGESKAIEIKVHKTKDNLVETTVTDHGIGIPTSVLPTLFEKFQRNHRTRDKVSGTGLGMYLSKAIVKAHGGNIWVKSKEGEGTTIGFTLQPYSSLADELKNSNDRDDIVRTAHGWIKNHNMYRR